MNYAKACDILETASKLGSRPGLGNIRRLCALLGGLQDSLKFVHVAGTNGKGSVCMMTAAILQAAGYKTGLYLSPYLEDYRDAFFINGRKISKTAFARTVSAVHRQAERMAKEGMYATEFEILTACAFFWFHQSGCDAVVLETGMGGRLDATNVIKTPLVSVLMAISFDHTAFLGDTIKMITEEKCGIIKPGGITVCYPDQDKAAVDVIEKAVSEKENVIVMPEPGRLKIICSDLDGTHFVYRGLEAHVGLGGRHQAINAVTAIETADTLRKYKGFLISDDEVKCGLRAAYLPARQEVLCRYPLILLDGAHNLQGIKALAESINNNIIDKYIVVVMGMLSDKQYEQSIAIMAGLGDKFIAVRPDNPRALDKTCVANIAKKYSGNVTCHDDATETLADAVASCGRDGAVVICGSLYLGSSMRKAFYTAKTLAKKGSP
ncbi:MAG: bifunctional folylpolyglutamate synthase/dihydrofolate synthase [Eubacteriales bacterium]|nr:bifunctional folylpolyglutamate synthase/dihydrofolate synthase [Eubacteriales bacterium]